MKTLKFKPHLVDKIIAGTKTATWRLFDDKDLTVGDVVTFFNKDTLYQFGIATIVKIKITTLGSLTEEDWEGHERFSSEEAMYQEYRSYYGDTVSPETEVKIISFNFEPKLYKKCVVVDEKDIVIGSEYIAFAIEKGLIRRASRVYVFNEAGQLLIQQRSTHVLKPLLLDQSAAGHVDEGESYEDAAKRELFEELGISGYQLVPVAMSFRDRDFYNSIYKIVVPNNILINFDPEEVAQVFWWTPAQVSEEINKEPEKFTPAFKEVWTKLNKQIISA